MAKNHDTDFSAKEPSLGYYYQLRYSLYLLLVNRGIEPVIQLETLDDIVVEEKGSTNIYQTKLHINSVANLTDASTDFWKTIRVWSQAVKDDLLVANRAIFTLVTTAPIGIGSFLLKLKIDAERDAESVRESMLTVIKNSTNLINAPAYKAFMSLEKSQQVDIVNNMYILDSSLGIDLITEKIRSELRYTTTPDKLDQMVERIEGWWFQQCIQVLTNQLESIPQKALQLKIYSIQDAFKTDNLPDDFADPASIDESDIEDYEHRIFIKQLQLVAVKSGLLTQALNDFRRAFEQRSRWVREGMINPAEEELFENRLYDHWKAIFSLLKDDCEGFDSAKLETVGNEFYKKYYVQNIPNIRIRDRFNSDYLTRGSCLILSDSKKIGWHPNFENLL